ncbi:hypothetical protein M9H77_17537 [Catharanthus roseus]|uniref:Uncharacterized protein n=1 Tax=Catharanthus roseus TaxID=4058 RepID=A0ACC0B4V5_CATRO|nr:hypothetical protein M9H77_17537 [Catharanthus roseus]
MEDREWPDAAGMVLLQSLENRWGFHSLVDSSSNIRRCQCYNNVWDEELPKRIYTMKAMTMVPILMKDITLVLTVGMILMEGGGECSKEEESDLEENERAKEVSEEKRENSKEELNLFEKSEDINLVANKINSSLT